MFIKTVNYKTLNNDDVKEDLYFNLTKTDIMEMEFSADGSFVNKIQRIVNSKDVPEIMSTFKGIILKAYGIKSEDGKRFIKNEKIREEFRDSLAFDALFQELLMDSEKASAFINGIMPDEIKAEIAKNKNKLPTPAPTKVENN